MGFRFLSRKRRPREGAGAGLRVAIVVLDMITTVLLWTLLGSWLVLSIAALISYLVPRP